MKKSLCKNIAAQKKRVEEYESAVEQLNSFRSLRENWRRLVKRGKLQQIHYWWHMSFLGPKDEPVDMSQIWNWMVKFDRAECKTFYSAVSRMLDETVKNYADKVEKLCR